MPERIKEIQLRTRIYIKEIGCIVIHIMQHHIIGRRIDMANLYNLLKIL